MEAICWKQSRIETPRQGCYFCGGNLRKVHNKTKFDIAINRNRWKCDTCGGGLEYGKRPDIVDKRKAPEGTGPLCPQCNSRMGQEDKSYHTVCPECGTRWEREMDADITVKMSEGDVIFGYGHGGAKNGKRPKKQPSAEERRRARYDYIMAGGC